jgi:HAD superfamily hydrolase (TIGR01509 family)
MADDLTAKIGAINAQLSKLGTEQLSFIQSIVDRLSQPFTFDRNLSSDLGVNLTPHEVLAIFTGDTERDTRERCVELGVTQIEEFWRARAKRLYRGFEGLREIAGISEAIAAIDRPVCVASNSSLFRLTRSLGRLPLWQEFNGHVFGADLVQRPKPAPDLLLLCASEMGVSAERAVMIDDSRMGFGLRWPLA